MATESDANGIKPKRNDEMLSCLTEPLDWMSRQKTSMAKIPWDYRVFVPSELGPEVKLKFLSYTSRTRRALEHYVLESSWLWRDSVPSELGPEMQLILLSYMSSHWITMS